MNAKHRLFTVAIAAGIIAGCSNEEKPPAQNSSFNVSTPGTVNVVTPPGPANAPGNAKVGTGTLILSQIKKTVQSHIPVCQCRSPSQSSNSEILHERTMVIAGNDLRWDHWRATDGGAWAVTHLPTGIGVKTYGRRTACARNQIGNAGRIRKHSGGTRECSAGQTRVKF